MIDESKHDRVYTDPKVQSLYLSGRGWQTFTSIPVHCYLGNHPIPNGAIVYRDRLGMDMICRSCMDDAKYKLVPKVELPKVVVEEVVSNPAITQEYIEPVHEELL